jgi:hypothetical protein
VRSEAEDHWHNLVIATTRGSLGAAANTNDIFGGDRRSNACHGSQGEGGLMSRIVEGESLMGLFLGIELAPSWPPPAREFLCASILPNLPSQLIHVKDSSRDWVQSEARIDMGSAP